MLLTGAHSFLKPSPPSLSPSLLFLFVPIPHLPFLPRQNQGTAGGGSVVPCTKAHTRHSGRKMFVKKKRTGEEGYWTFAPLLPLSTAHKPIYRASLSRRWLSLFVRRRQVPSQTPRDDDLSRYIIFFPRSVLEPDGLDRLLEQ